MGIPGSPNPLLMRRAAAAATDDGYQIKRSLRFDEDSDANLKKTIAADGNRLQWTFSCWLKNCLDNGGWWLFGKGNSYFQVVVDGTESWIRCNQRTNGGNTWWDSGRHINDPGAWYNIVIALDYTQTTNADKIKLYINGVLDPAAAGQLGKNYRNTNTELLINQAGDHYIGSNSNPDGGGGYLADVYFIDGQQLSPAAFGSFDSTGVWTPSSFSIPAPNNGTTWSNDGDATNMNSSYPWSKAFDGIADGTYGNGAGADDGDGWARWTPTDGITVKASLRLNTDNGTTSAVKVKFSSGKNTSVQHLKELTDGWNDVEGSGVLEYIEIYNSGSEWSYLCGVEIDGVVLRDGTTDPATRNNPNDGRTWSSTVASGFNGNPNDNYLTTSTDTITVNFSPGIPYNELRFASDSGAGTSSADMQYSINGGTLTNFIGAGVEAVVSVSGSNTLTSFAIKNTTATNCRWNYLKVDGHHLINGATDNSVGFNFSDASSDSALGKDTLNGKIAEATGGLPIYNTSDDYGEVKGSGNRDLANKANLVYALPGDVIDGDVSHSSDLRNSGAKKTTTASGNAALSTDESRFYGKSIKFDGASDHLSIGASSDFAFGTGEFCIEVWVKLNSTTGTFWDSGAVNSNNNLAWFNDGSNTNVRCKGAGSESDLTVSHSTSGLSTGKWTHMALVRASGNIKLYIDGVEKGSVANDGDITATGGRFGTLNGYVGSYDANCHIQNIAVYKGTSRYTSNFKPPIRNNWSANNLAAVVGHPNDGRTWSDSLTGNWSTSGGYHKQYLFDNTYPSIPQGAPASGMASGTGTSSFGFDLGASNKITGVTSLRVILWTPGSNWWSSYPMLINGTNVISSHFTGVVTADTYGWVDFGTTFTELESMSWGSYHWYIAGIEVNGELLTDGAGSGASGIDSLLDSPTNYTDSSDVVHGNYCTLNPLDTADNSGSNTLKHGNLYAEGTSSSGAWHKIRSTMAIPKGDTGKWYYEVEILNSGSGIGYDIGWDDPFFDSLFAGGMGDNAGSWCYKNIGQKRSGGTSASYGNSYANGNVIGIGYDNGSIYFWKDGTIQNSGTAAYTGVSATLCPTVSLYTESNAVAKLSVNFGQRAFKHAQSGYKGYCTQNLSDLFSGAAVNNPSKYFDARIYTGDGSTSGNTVSGLAFEPDLVWIKRRDAVTSHMLYDVVRGFGVNKALIPNDTYIEGDTSGVTEAQYGFLNSVTSDGFVVKSGSSSGVYTNQNDSTYVSWNWDAGTAASGANNDGSINVSAGNQWKNTAAGFSITKYTSNNTAGATVGHGLGAVPELIIVKNTDDTNNWNVYHQGLGNTHGLYLDLNNSQGDDNTLWNDTSPTSDVFTIGNGNGVNNSSSHEYIAYCWTSKPGFSAFGSYEGQVFVYTGFRPKYVCIKTAISSSSWHAHTTDPIDKNNPVNVYTRPDLTSAEATDSDLDIYSNGFYPRATGTWITDTTMVYIAFAEHPFKTARAR